MFNGDRVQAYRAQRALKSEGFTMMKLTSRQIRRVEKNSKKLLRTK